MRFRKVPCTTAPPYPLVSPHLLHNAGHGAGPHTVVGAGLSDYMAQVSGLISTAEGSFPSISGVTSETGTNPYTGATNVPNAFMLQLNSNVFACAPAFLAAFPSCSGSWVQFVFSNNNLGGEDGTGPAVTIEYWLFNSTCPAGWYQESDGVCERGIQSGYLPVQMTIADLTDPRLTGNAVSGGLDTVILSTSSDMYSASGEDSWVNLAERWNVAEFNIFGDGSLSEANFNAGSTIIVRTSVDDGTTNAPTCVMGSTTGETNNLTLAPPCRPQGGASPAIEFTESNVVQPVQPVLTPTVNNLGVVNNASFAAGSNPIAPGVIAAVFGANLTNGSSVLFSSFGANGTLVNTLAGATVTINGAPVPIFYATPTQLGIQIPVDLAGYAVALIENISWRSDQRGPKFPDRAGIARFVQYRSKRKWPRSDPDREHEHTGRAGRQHSWA